MHEAIDFLRRDMRFNAYCSLDEMPEKAIEPDLIGKLSAAEILKVLHELPEIPRIVFNLHVLEGYNHREISESLGFSEGTSKWYLNQARKRLRKRLEILGYETISR